MLTNDDVKALRQADRLSFHFHNGETEIVATRENRTAGPFDDRERKHRIAAESRFRGGDGDKPRACFAMLHGMWEDANCGPTLARLVKPADQLRLQWIADNSNGYLTQARERGVELFRDELHLQIVRKGKPFAMLFVESSICPNNTARMCRF